MDFSIAEAEQLTGVPRSNISTWEPRICRAIRRGCHAFFTSVCLLCIAITRDLRRAGFSVEVCCQAASMLHELGEKEIADAIREDRPFVVLMVGPSGSMAVPRMFGRAALPEVIGVAKDAEARGGIASFVIDVGANFRQLQSSIDIVQSSRQAIAKQRAARSKSN